jgi:hypothetical protein
MSLELARSAVLLNAEYFRPDFYDWLTDNWHIFTAFEHQADMVWARGRTHYSARTIIEYLRHETSVREAGDGWKINDWYTPCLARLYVMLHPDRKLFEFRGERKAA